jgi:hypothetical protein
MSAKEKEVTRLFWEQVNSKLKYINMMKKMSKMTTRDNIKATTKLLKLMMQDEKYKSNVIYLRRKRQMYYFKKILMIRQEKMRDHSRLSYLALVAGVIAEGEGRLKKR